MRTCGWCSTSLEGRRAHARWCSVKCRTYSVRRRVRAERVRIAVLRRPRCMICSKALPYGKSGFTFKARTCSMECHIKFTNWFQRKGVAAA